MAIEALLKITVIKGKNLAVRDVFSSDPYVKLKLNGHEVKTRTIYRDLNPEWNEELTLAVPDPLVPLQLFVYDKDMFVDDKMGNATVDLHPLVAAAAKHRENVQNLEEGRIIDRVFANNQNDLAKDSIIKLKGGSVVQEMSLKLQNVEKGQVKLELKWHPVKP